MAKFVPKEVLGDSTFVAVYDPESGDTGYVRMGDLVSKSETTVTAVTSPGGGNRFLTSGDLIVDAHAALRRGSRHIPGKPIVRCPDSTNGVTLGPDMTISVVERKGRKCWEVVFPGGTTAARNVTVPITNRAYSKNISTTFEIEDANEWNGGNFRVGIFTSSAMTNGMRFIQTIGASNAWNGVHVLAPRSDEWATVGSGAWTDVMTHFVFTGVRRSTPATTTSTRIWIYEITEDEQNTLPSIILGADDGHGTWYSGGLPILEKYGFASYLAYIHDAATAGAPSMTVSQWQEAIARGHYAVVHGCKSGVASLRDYFTSHAGYATPYDAIVADVAYNRDGMVKNGLDPDGRGRRIYVLPQGNFQPASGAGDTTIEHALIAAGFKTARRNLFQNSVMANGGWSSARLYLTTLGHTYSATDEASNIAALIARMESEISAGRSVIFTFHNVRETPSVAEDISPANLEAIVSAANALVLAGKAKRGRLTDFADELDTYYGPVHVGE